jgi:hypothetical protein
MVSHWLIDSSSSALSSQHPQTLRFFPREVKNINHDRYFPQGLERSNPHENYPHTRETCCASCHARPLAQQVFLVCGRRFSETPDSSPVARVVWWEWVRFLSISDVCCQRLTRERAYSPVLKYNEGLWKSQVKRKQWLNTSILWYAAFVNSERWLAKSRVDTQYMSTGKIVYVSLCYIIKKIWNISSVLIYSQWCLNYFEFVLE